MRRLSGNLFIDHRGKLELVVVAVLVAAFMLATGVGNFDETLNDQRRGAMYGSLAGTAGALLGFTLAALAILVTLPSRERIESLRGPDDPDARARGEERVEDRPERVACRCPTASAPDGGIRGLILRITWQSWATLRADRAADDPHGH